MESKHTKGKCSKRISRGGKYIYVSCDWIDFARIVRKVDGFVDEQGTANANIIVDAFNVTNETNKTPRELQKSHAELLDALEKVSTNMAIDYATSAADFDKDLHFTVNQVIKNAKQ